jgi:hypothetical protein
MGRPTLDPAARKINVQVAPPAELDADMRALWAREFARFPAGYFVPSDVRGMVLYLDALRIYERARRRLEAAEDAEETGIGARRKECRAAMGMVHKLQRDLRMFPSTRTHREIHGSLANNPTTQAAQPGEDGWRGLFAVPNGSDKPTRKRSKPA